MVTVNRSKSIGLSRLAAAIMIPVINAARQENSRRSVRIASCPRKTKLGILRGDLSTRSPTLELLKKLRVALHAITAGYPTVGDGTSAAK
jgi:hypothetical protein